MSLQFCAWSISLSDWPPAWDANGPTQTMVFAITHKTAPLGMDDWLNGLSQGLLELAQQSAQDRAALQRMLM